VGRVLEREEVGGYEETFEGERGERVRRDDRGGSGEVRSSVHISDDRR